MRLQARDLVLDAEPTSYQVQNMPDGTHHNVFVSQRGVVPVTDGTYITERRRIHRASARFLQSLEREPRLRGSTSTPSTDSWRAQCNS